MPIAIQTQPFTQGAGSEQHYTNTRQETDRPGRCYTITNSHSDLCPNSAHKPMVNNNEIEYLPPGSNQDNDRRASVETTNDYKEILQMFLVE